MKRSEDSVAYVSLQQAKNFFITNANLKDHYAFLCPNGTTTPVSTEKPCVWLTQPWKLVITPNDLSVTLAKKLGKWMYSGGPNSWEASLRDILTKDSYQITDVTNIVSVRDYINPIRAIPAPNPMCQTT
jgi:hypothetical protein